MGVNLCDLELRKDFLDMELNVHSVKEKKQMINQTSLKLKMSPLWKETLTIKKMKRQVTD